MKTQLEAITYAITHLDATEIMPGWYAFFEEPRFCKVSKEDLTTLGALLIAARSDETPTNIYCEWFYDTDIAEMPAWWAPDQRTNIDGERI